MSEILEVYKTLVTDENRLYRRIEALDVMQSYILQSVHKHGAQLDTLTFEDALIDHPPHATRLANRASPSSIGKKHPSP